MNVKRTVSLAAAMLAVSMATLAGGSAFAADRPASSAGRDVEWKLFNSRLGMFIHWGIYSVGEWHCQQLWRGFMSRQEYDKYMHKFPLE